MLLAGLIAAAAIGAIGSAVGAGINYQAQKEANKTNVDLQNQANELQVQMMREANAFSAEEAAKQRAWETEMSNTQYQRAMADMETAGINPMLAGSFGGATAGTGYAATPTMGNVSAAKVKPEAYDITGITNAIQSATNMMIISQMLENKTPTFKNDGEKFLYNLYNKK